MPTTPKLLLPYPVGPDPADVPTDMLELADRIDDLAGIASGLATLDSGGKVPSAQLPQSISPTIVDAKGDLIVGTGADAVARLAPGALHQVLVADPAQPGGVKWAYILSVSARTYSCVLESDAPTTLTTSVLAQISAWGIESYDPNGMHTPGAATIVVPVAGVYLITGYCFFAANATGRRTIQIRVGGVAKTISAFPAVSDGGGTAVTIVAQLALAAGDSLDLVAGQYSGGDLSVSSGAKFSATQMTP